MRPWLHPVRRFLAKFEKPHIILPISFLNSTAFTIVGFGFVYYLRDGYHACAGSIGLAAALYSGLYFAGCFALRPLTTRLLPRYSAILSSLISALLLTGIVVASDLTVTVMMYGLFGFGAALFWPPVVGWLSAGSEGKELNRIISRFNIAWSFGSIIGPFAAGLLVEIDLRLPLVVAAGIVLTNAVIIGVASALAGSIRTDTYREQPARGNAGTDRSTTLRYPSWIGNVAGYTVLGVLLVVFPLYGRDVLGIPESSVGAILLLRGFASAGLFLLAGRNEWWHFRRPIIPVPGLLLAGVLVLIFVVRTPVAFGALVGLAGAPLAAAYTLSVFHGAAGSLDRTRRMAIHEALLTVGNISGSAAGGWVYQHHGWSTTVLFCFVVVAIAVLTQLLFLAGSRRADGPNSGHPVVLEER